MRLGARSRYLLEFLAAFGLEAFDGLIALPQFHRMINCSSERNFLRRARMMDENGLIDYNRERENGAWVAKLTDKGKSAIDGDIDPELEWNAPWDGNWRLFAFDLPQNKPKERQALRQWLKRMRLGKLQGSLWITPKDLSGKIHELAKLKIDPTAAVLFKGEFESGLSPQNFVTRCWNFKKINEQYLNYQNFIVSETPQILSPENFPDWFFREVGHWRHAFNSDPFLPKVLWPRGFATHYLGPKALAARKRVYDQWKQKMLSERYCTVKNPRL